MSCGLCLSISVDGYSEFFTLRVLGTSLSSLTMLVIGCIVHIFSLTRSVLQFSPLMAIFHIVHQSEMASIVVCSHSMAVSLSLLVVCQSRTSPHLNDVRWVYQLSHLDDQSILPKVVEWFGNIEKELGHHFLFAEFFGGVFNRSLEFLLLLHIGTFKEIEPRNF